jgi:hypothetical protein
VCAKKKLSPTADLGLRRTCFCRTTRTTLSYVVFFRLSSAVKWPCYVISFGTKFIWPIWLTSVTITFQGDVSSRTNWVYVCKVLTFRQCCKWRLNAYIFTCRLQKKNQFSLFMNCILTFTFFDSYPNSVQWTTLTFCCIISVNIISEYIVAFE